MKLTRSFRRTRQTIYRGLMLMLAVAMAITSQMSLAEQGKSEKRVAIVTDTSTHLGPWVARELAQRNHNLVIGTPAEGLAEELRAMGAEVEVVTGVEDLTDPASIKKLVQAAVKRFGGFDAAMIRSGMHLTGDIFQATPEDMQASFEGNTMSVFYALQEILPVLVKQGRGGQVVINTSATGERPFDIVLAYSVMRAAANMLVRTAAMSVAEHGITVNATGTNFIDYPGFRDTAGVGDPKVMEEFVSIIPMHRLGKPEEAAHFAASLLDGKNMFQTGNFFPISGGYNND